jgi:hypothetical protein
VTPAAGSRRYVFVLSALIRWNSNAVGSNVQGRIPDPGRPIKLPVASNACGITIDALEISRLRNLATLLPNGRRRRTDLQCGLCEA